MATVALTKDTFAPSVTGEGIVLVDFWAAWCGPCRQFAPVFEQASEQPPGHRVRQGRHRGTAGTGRRGTGVTPSPP